MTLPCQPTQITVDPDRVLLDERPGQQPLEAEIRWRLTPLYTQLDEADVTNAYDRSNVIFGPWMYGSAYADPWFTKSPHPGLQGGRLSHAGVSRRRLPGATARTTATSSPARKALVDHFPFPRTQVGFFLERSSAPRGDDVECSRGVVYGRYMMMYGSSLICRRSSTSRRSARIRTAACPTRASRPPGADPFDERTGVGMHYHKNFSDALLGPRRRRRRST